MIKVNKLGYEDILSYMEFMDKYGSRLKEEYDKGEISQEVLDHMTACIIDHTKVVESRYINLIKEIYYCIIDVKYINYPDGGHDTILKLIESIEFLERFILITSDIDFATLCNAAYNDLSTGCYSGYLNSEMEEEFKPEHLLDIGWHLNNFKKYSTNKEFLKEIEREEVYYNYGSIFE